jgi:hypothetical protein
MSSVHGGVLARDLEVAQTPLQGRLVYGSLATRGEERGADARMAGPAWWRFCSPSKIHAARVPFIVGSAASVNSRETRGAQNSAQSFISLRRFSSLAPR